eukprot:Pompholyxophrys_punicea_v1_NODE_1031_length_1026_cov_2.289095.p1 type:complete len:246 gc:universal NODE_1031_length_1026_cov_2.289095:831-94(-)
MSSRVGRSFVNDFRTIENFTRKLCFPTDKVKLFGSRNLHSSWLVESQTEIIESQLDVINGFDKELHMARFSGVMFEMLTKLRVESEKSFVFCVEAMKSEEDWVFYQGVGEKAWRVIFESVKMSAQSMTYWGGLSRRKRKNRTKISLMNQMFLTIAILKLALPLKVFSDAIKISRAYVSKIFTSWLSLLFNHLSALPWWPSRESVQQNMPPSFKLRHPRCRVILDGTEFFIGVPKHTKTQGQTYSE